MEKTALRTDVGVSLEKSLAEDEDKNYNPYRQAYHQHTREFEFVYHAQDVGVRNLDYHFFLPPFDSKILLASVQYFTYL